MFLALTSIFGGDVGSGIVVWFAELHSSFGRPIYSHRIHCESNLATAAFPPLISDIGKN
jgi:hypothetical protein